MHGHNVSTDKPRSGTICKSVCDKGYGFMPDSVRHQTCLANGRWQGGGLICIKEDQFVIFLLRTSSGTDKNHICMISDENGNVKKVDYIVCLYGKILFCTFVLCILTYIHSIF